MKPNTKPRSSWINQRELIQIWNEKLVCAARDLAEFTKNGITASYIVALAHKCEYYEGAIEEAPIDPQGNNARETEQEISDAVEKICQMGRRIWPIDSSKYNDYVIS